MTLHAVISCHKASMAHHNVIRLNTNFTSSILSNCSTPFQLEYDSELGTLIKADKKNEECIDGAPLVTGLACLLKQMHPSATAKLLSYLGQYVRAQIQQTYGESDAADGEKAKAPDMPSMVIKMMLFLEQLCRLSSIPRSAVHAYVPAYIFDSIALTKAPH